MYSNFNGHSLSLFYKKIALNEHNHFVDVWGAKTNLIKDKYLKNEKDNNSWSHVDAIPPPG